MPVNKKTYYFVIGSNNFWYSMDTTLKDAKDTLKHIKKNDIYGDPESGYNPEYPNTAYIVKGEMIFERDL